ncbi:MAG: hypothetical protein ACI9VM_000125 [Candidatus Azotimanducaceae bacterium]|jgi:hypothetical protein
MKEIFSVFLVAYTMFFVSSANASTLYIEPAESEIHPGDTIALSVRINTDEGECINAVDGVIEYPPHIVPVDIALGNSIFPVWVEFPVIDKENRRITFAGGIPNGYCGRIEGDPRLTNVILELIFQTSGVITEGFDSLAHIDFTSETSVLLNDGAGTPAKLRTLGNRIAIFNTPREEVVDQWNARVEDDETPPGKFSISLSGDSSAFGGRYFISFNTTDKQSGIDHYEVIEEPLDQLQLFNWGAVDAPWIVAKSPYKLADQSLNSTVRVKAVDKAGNEYIAILIPEESMRGLSNQTKLYIGFGFILLVFAGAYIVYRRKIRSYKDLESDAAALAYEDRSSQNNDD